MCKDRFLFFENFKTIADKLPDDLRLKYYDALTDYVFKGVEPEDAIITALITAIKPSLDKEDGRKNNGGNHNPTGKNQFIKEREIEQNQKYLESLRSIPVNYGQCLDNVGQLGSIPLETRNKKQETGNNIIISSDKSSDMIVKNEAFDISKINEVLGKHNLAEIKKLTDERKTKLKQRCSDVGGFDEFLLQMDLALGESAFLRGDNKQGWKADFDFFLQKSSWQKAIEGGYRDNKPPERTLAEKQREEQLMDEMINRVWKDD